MRRVSEPSKQAGFTIVELMIALVVLATLLITATVVLIHLGDLFSKGTNEANTQNTTRNLMGDLVAQIKLGGNKPTPVPPSTAATASPASHPSSLGVLCIGNQRYTYVINLELGGVDPVSGNTVQHALWHDTMKDSGTCSPISDTVAHFETATIPSDSQSQANSGSEVLPNHTRLIDFNVTPTTTAGTYIVKVTLANGDSDVMSYNPAADTVTCLGGSGDPYCATASLTGIATQRVQ